MSNTFARVAASLIFEMNPDQFRKMAANEPDMIRHLYPDQWVKFATFQVGKLTPFIGELFSHSNAAGGIAGKAKKFVKKIVPRSQLVRVKAPAFATAGGQNEVFSNLKNNKIKFSEAEINDFRKSLFQKNKIENKLTRNNVSNIADLPTNDIFGLINSNGLDPRIGEIIT